MARTSDKLKNLTLARKGTEKEKRKMSNGKTREESSREDQWSKSHGSDKI